MNDEEVAASPEARHALTLIIAVSWRFPLGFFKLVTGIERGATACPFQQESLISEITRRWRLPASCLISASTASLAKSPGALVLII